MSKYWDINRILRYQRNFNFINGERSIGKTYTTQKWLVNKALTTGRQFVYLCRTKTDKFNKAFSEAFEKVLDKEFPDNDIVCDNENMYSGEGDEKGRIGYCLALSEAPDVKKRSFPKVDYIMFDEYMLEREHNFKYVTGWHEPDLLLNIYHTIDRESDRVKVFCLGNTTEFYNPYHTHKAFNIPAVEKGKIWYSDNVLFQWAEKSEELKEEKSNSKFLSMIEGTKYGTYANDGEYIDNSDVFIESRPNSSKYMFAIEYMSNIYGIWQSNYTSRVYVSKVYEHDNKILFAISPDDHNENTILSKNTALLQWLAKQYRMSNVRFETKEIKAKSELAIRRII